jgi:hypothetical protein
VSNIVYPMNEVTKSRIAVVWNMWNHRVTTYRVQWGSLMRRMTNAQPLVVDAWDLTNNRPCGLPVRSWKSQLVVFLGLRLLVSLFADLFPLPVLQNPPFRVAWEPVQRCCNWFQADLSGQIRRVWITPNAHVWFHCENTPSLDQHETVVSISYLCLQNVGIIVDFNTPIPSHPTNL